MAQELIDIRVVGLKYRCNLKLLKKFRIFPFPRVKINICVTRTTISNEVTSPSVHAREVSLFLLTKIAPGLKTDLFVEVNRYRHISYVSRNDRKCVTQNYLIKSQYNSIVPVPVIHCSNMLHFMLLF